MLNQLLISVPRGKRWQTFGREVCQILSSHSVTDKRKYKSRRAKQSQLHADNRICYTYRPRQANTWSGLSVQASLMTDSSITLVSKVE